MEKKDVKQVKNELFELEEYRLGDYHVQDYSFTDGSSDMVCFAGPMTSICGHNGEFIVDFYCGIAEKDIDAAILELQNAKRTIDTYKLKSGSAENMSQSS